MYHNALIIVATCWKLDLEVWVQSASYMFYRYIPGLDRKSGQPSWMPQNSRNCRNIAEIAEMPDFLKTLLLLQFLFDHSEFFTGETRHIMPPCNKAGISNFCLEFQKLQKFQWKRHFSSVLIRSFWNFTGETRYIVWPYNKARISNWFWGQLDCSVLANLLKQKVLKYVIMHSLWQLS